MALSPNNTRSVQVDNHLREYLSFNPASEETLQRTNLAKSFLEDYYKHIPTRPTPPPKAEGDVNVNGNANDEAEEDDEEEEDVPPPLVKSKSQKIKKISSNHKKLKASRSSPQITRPFSVIHESHVGFVKGSGLQVQNLPDELRSFVENLNVTLGRLGAKSVTEEELKLVLASASIPDPAVNSSGVPHLPSNNAEVIDVHNAIDCNVNSSFDNFTPGGTNSYSEPISPPQSHPPSTHEVQQQLQKPLPPQPPKLENQPVSPRATSPQPSPHTTPSSRPSSPPPNNSDSDDMNVVISNGTTSKDSKTTSRTRKLTTFFSNMVNSPHETSKPPTKMSRSLSLESSHSPKNASPKDESFEKPQSKSLSKSGGFAGFEKALPSKGLTKTGGFEISGPRNFAKVGGFDFGGESPSAVKIKLDLADNALRNETQLRLSAEEKVANLEFMVSKLTLELEQSQNQANTLATLLDEATKKLEGHNAWRKQTDSEVNMLRRKIAIKTKSEEDTLASESKKRRQLEIQIAELKAQKVNAPISETSHRLVQDVKAQLTNAESEVMKVKAQLNDERNHAQEENETLRKELEAMKTVMEREKQNWGQIRKKWQSDIDAGKVESQKKVDEATKRLEVERKQRRVDQMMYETLINNNHLLESSLTNGTAHHVDGPDHTPINHSASPPTHSSSNSSHSNSTHSATSNSTHAFNFTHSKPTSPKPPSSTASTSTTSLSSSGSVNMTASHDHKQTPITYSNANDFKLNPRTYKAPLPPPPPSLKSPPPVHRTVSFNLAIQQGVKLSTPKMETKHIVEATESKLDLLAKAIIARRLRMEDEDEQVEENEFEN